MSDLLASIIDSALGQAGGAKPGESRGAALVRLMADNAAMSAPICPHCGGPAGNVGIRVHGPGVCGMNGPAI